MFLATLFLTDDNNNVRYDYLLQKKKLQHTLFVFRLVLYKVRDIEINCNIDKKNSLNVP